MPDLDLPSTAGDQVNVSKLSGWSVLYFYPMTGRPDLPLPDGWDDIPGARGCTPQAFAFRNHSQELRKAGAANLFGVSTQNMAEQQEAARRLHLPFALLSDSRLNLAEAMSLPTITVEEGRVLIKRLTLILQDNVIRRVFYPVFPLNQNATQVLRWFNTRS